MRKIILGGTFAPPTLAHRALLLAGMEAFSAERGVYVPAPLSYARIWRSDRLPPPFFQSDENRIAMLSAMIGDDSRFEICDRELQNPDDAYTYHTLCALTSQNAGDELAWLMGSDLLPKLSKWLEADSLLARFPLYVSARAGDDVDAIIAGDPFLTARRDRIHLLALGAENSDVTATRVRDAILSGDLESASRDLAPSVLLWILENLSAGKEASV